jgi:hypothetical protein
VASPGAFEHIAITRLPELQTADGLFRATPGIEPDAETVHGSRSLRAGAIVLLGLLRADEVGLEHPFSTGALRTRILGDLAGPDAGPGELGLALWAESRADGGAVNEITGLLSEKLSKGFDRIPLRRLAWLVSGLTEASARVGRRSELDSLLEGAETALVARAVTETGFMSDLHHRIGGGLTPVSGQFHSLTALELAERAGRAAAAAGAARALLSALLEIQREDGSWPGVVDPIRGEAAALYPVFTVTQVALAPLALRQCGETGLPGDVGAATDAGIAWAGGNNRLGFDLVHENEARLDRGIMPKRKPTAVSRGFTSAARRLRGRLPEPERSDLILDPEVSSEDLGWVLEAWAGR